MFLPTFMTSEHPGSHVFQQTRTISIHIQDIIKTNILTNPYKEKMPRPLFHDDRTINMASRVLTRKNATPPWRPYIIGTNHLTKFHDDWTINVASRVLTKKNAPPPGGHISLGQNLLTKFHEDRKINVASRVFKRKNAPSIIFELVQDIIGVNLLTKFHKDRTINVASRVFFHLSGPFSNSSEISMKPMNTAPPPGGHLHEDWASNVTSTVFTSIELSRGINGTNVLTKFHEDQTINVASRVFTRQNVDDGRRTKSDHKSSP
ncbi:hypothetical protein DPMN_080211 [Dreissena polymorpha]|uniref:Uncharacterized protein n=1 Tax=Dreissena polymorpha TaxID=45954 RepID=A0A9D3YV72_DREPO|nr:hypothetical protein DPMN_080211 [Dreissena polymorpha]